MKKIKIIEKCEKKKLEKSKNVEQIEKFFMRQKNLRSKLFGKMLKKSKNIEKIQKLLKKSKNVELFEICWKFSKSVARIKKY